MLEKIKQIKKYAGLKVPEEIEIIIDDSFFLELIPHSSKAKQAIDYFNKTPEKKYQILLKELNGLR